MPFPKMAKIKPSETVLFSWIVYKNKAHRNKVNKLVMKDPRIAEMCDPKNSPFDVNRMAYGGFKVIVEA
jgi:alkaline phosphatase